ncbi:nuclear pore complex protein Nup155-like [Antedon mediterranea]|uniref:nuclear pore complex protein Nup155-like n=1 Tax=Antedon mediterranea TaxID=105859 RepID=UPI003AF5437A
MYSQNHDDTLHSSSQHVQSSIQQDRSFKELATLLPSGFVSGNSDLDYPSVSESVSLSHLVELSTVKRVPLPPDLAEQFQHMKCNCGMGVFPTISRAWLSIDSDIYVWNYEDGGDLAYFDGLNETILSAGLVKPKPGIFKPHIKFLLVVTTPVKIALLGVSFTKPQQGEFIDNYYGEAEMHLLPDPLFSIPTDNVYMLSIVGTASGRIFLAGKDGCIYEVVYQAHDGWFSRKCYKVNHSKTSLSFLIPSILSFSDEDPIVQISIDDSRHILYTLSECSNLCVYDLGADCSTMSLISRVYLNTLIKEARAIAQSIDHSHFKKIVHISALTQKDSRMLHVVAVTHTGVRLYMTTNVFAANRSVSDSRPCMLKLLHVRLPPGFTSNSNQRPDNVHAAHFSQGTVLLCASETEDSDVLWCISPDAFPFEQKLMETYVKLPIDSHAWVIAEMKGESLTKVKRPSIIDPILDPPLVVRQHRQLPTRFVVLSAHGSYLVNKLRPVDQLRQLMVTNGGPDNNMVQSFFKLHMVDQACASCLILACSRIAQDQQVSEWAAQAFFRYGGEPKAKGMLDTARPTGIGPSFTSTTPVSGQGMLQASNIATPAAGMHPGLASTPLNTDYQRSPAYQGTASGDLHPDIEFSGKFKGLYLYFSRLLSPIWDGKIVHEARLSKRKDAKIVFYSSQDSTDLSWFLAECLSLNTFLDKHSQFSDISQSIQDQTPGLGRADSVLGLQSKQEQRSLLVFAVNAEKRALQDLEQLVKRSCEVLALWKLLCDHQFHIVASHLIMDAQERISKMTFNDLVVNGKEMCSSMISALISCYIGDNTTTDAISQKLRDVCPTLYTVDDAICSKATEMLSAALECETKSNKDQLLRDSLQYFKQISHALNLVSICADFHKAHFYNGVIDLCLAAATKRDPQNLALHYYKNGQPAELKKGMDAFVKRLECYKCITDIFESLLNASQALAESPLPSRPGPAPTVDTKKLTRDEAAFYFEDMLQRALKSDDELFHVALYDWFVARGLTDRLLQINSSFVEPYIKRAANHNPDNLEMLDLLWKYHEKTNNYAAAARILAKLADRHSTDLTLQQRIEYTSRAIMCAKSSNLITSTATDGEFLHELEEKMEVARLQLQVFEAISQFPGQDPRVQEALSQLSAQLMDITKLYGDYAEVFQLSECKLSIVHCAGHYEPLLVESLWQEILEKEFQEASNKPVTSQVIILTNKIVSLGKQYQTSERYFPVSFLILFLEKKSIELQLTISWVFKAFLAVNVPLQKLHQIYDRHYKAKDPFWQTSLSPLHMVNVICSLLNHFADTPSLVPSIERRSFITTCLDCIASYKVELEATAVHRQVVQAMLARFKQLQAKLDKLL